MRRDGLFIKCFLVAGLLAMLAGTRAFRPDARHLMLTPVIDLAGEGWMVRVMTWNIGEAYSGGESRASAAIIDRVTQVVRMEKPEVVALQELTGAGQLEKLLSRLEGEYQGFLEEGLGSDRYAAILIKGKAQFRLVPTKSGRDAVAAVFRLPRSQLRIAALSVHANAWNPEERARYTRELVDWGRGQDYDVVFLAGDFNFEGGSGGAGESLFTRSPLTDSAAYAYARRYFQDLGVQGGDTAIAGRRIDYVFARGGDLKVKRVAVLKGQRAARMDHRPLVIDALIPKPLILTQR